jgi:formylglycine-generating enzyme required for sulfatase activity
MGNTRQVFVSYSHRDSEWLERLMPFLRTLEREAVLRVWSDREIQIASDWHADIQKALNEADAAILLISQDFLASDYIANNELPQLLSAARERGLKVFPVFVRLSRLKDSPLLRFQAVNSPTSPLDKLDRGEQDEILVKLAESIEDLLKVSMVGVTEEWLGNFSSGFMPIAGGTYIMGDNELHGLLHALKEHEVSVSSCRMGKCVVTQSEWRALMNTRPWLNERNVKYGDNFPAVYVSWYDAMDFIRAINQADSQYAYRLPTEAEWEYAARGGQEASGKPRTKFSFGDDANKLLEYGWHDQNASLRGNAYAQPVGQLRPNQLGLFDMHGNVWEWTSDNDLGMRVVRGGGFNAGAQLAASAYRGVLKPEMKGEAAGFRLIQETKVWR